MDVHSDAHQQKCVCVHTHTHTKNTHIVHTTNTTHAQHMLTQNTRVPHKLHKAILHTHIPFI